MTSNDAEKRLMPEDVPAEASAPETERAAPEGGDGEQPALAALEAEIARLKDQLLRALAETDNLRKRSAKEREDAGKYAVSGFARDMLEIADNFQRAMDAVPAEARAEDPALKNLMDGIEATERGMLKTFEKHGIRKIEPLDQIFDPNFHEVMFETPAPGKAAGTIVQLLEPGYTLHDRLLRPARVGVAKGDGTAPPSHAVDETA